MWPRGIQDEVQMKLQNLAGPEAKLLFYFYNIITLQIENI